MPLLSDESDAAAAASYYFFSSPPQLQMGAGMALGPLLPRWRPLKGAPRRVRALLGTDPRGVSHCGPLRPLLGGRKMEIEMEAGLMVECKSPVMKLITIIHLAFSFFWKLFTILKRSSVAQVGPGGAIHTGTREEMILE